MGPGGLLLMRLFCPFLQAYICTSLWSLAFRLHQSSAYPFILPVRMALEQVVDRRDGSRFLLQHIRGFFQGDVFGEFLSDLAYQL